MLETPAKLFYKGRNYAPFKNFQDQKYENATMALCKLRDDAIEDKDKIYTTIWHPPTFHVDIFVCLRHPQSHSRKVETMHLLRIFKTKSMKMRLRRIAKYETMQQKKKNKISTTNWTFTHFPRRDFLCLRHSQSHSRKVETMHLWRIFKIKSMKMRLWRIANY